MESTKKMDCAPGWKLLGSWAIPDGIVTAAIYDAVPLGFL
jgi:hypothetical protein